MVEQGLSAFFSPQHFENPTLRFRVPNPSLLAVGAFIGSNESNEVWPDITTTLMHWAEAAGWRPAKRSFIYRSCSTYNEGPFVV